MNIIVNLPSTTSTSADVELETPSESVTVSLLTRISQGSVIH